MLLIMKKAYCFLLFLSFLIDIAAQYRISGVVTDQESKPLDGANVLLYSETDTLQSISSTLTDSQGAWNFVNLQSGNYYIQCVLLGYEQRTENLRLSNKNLDLDTIRMKIAFESLQEVVITADLLQIQGVKETRLFSMDEKARAVSGLELMTNIPHLSLDQLNNKLITIDRKPILIVCNGKIIDEVDLIGFNPNEIIKVDYYAQPPAKYRNMGIEAVLSVTTKRGKDKGGSVTTNLTNGFTTGYGTNIIQGNYSSGENDYSLRYFIDYRDLNKNRLTQQWEAELDEKPYQINRKGENSDYRGQYHVFTGAFSNLKTDNQLFSAKARLALNPGVENSRQSVSGELLSTDTKTRYVCPKLDLYYSKKIGNNQELLMNLVNTYYDTKSERNIYNIATNIESKSYSIITEAEYTNHFHKYELDIGIRHLYKNLNENYHSNDDFLTSRNAINTLYAYTEISGNWDQYSATVGIGGEKSWLNISPNNKSYFVFKPEITLTCALNKSSSFKFESSTQSYVPDISILLESPAYLDSIFISRGNSLLKPYYMFVNSLFYILNKPVYYFQTTFSYFYSHRPYYTIINNNGTYLEKTYSNIDNMKTLKYDMLLNWKIIHWLSLKAYGSMEYQQFRVDGDLYNHWFYMYNVSASMYYKVFTLSLQALKQNKSLEGNLYRTIQNYYSGDITWKKNNLSLSLSCMFFNSPEIIETSNHFPVYYKESKVWDNFKGLCYLRLSYTLDFGKNIQRSVKQQLNNEDKDIGINPDNRAKQ